jgi:hypothetical protein
MIPEHLKDFKWKKEHFKFIKQNKTFTIIKDGIDALIEASPQIRAIKSDAKIAANDRETTVVVVTTIELEDGRIFSDVGSTSTGEFDNSERYTKQKYTIGQNASTDARRRAVLLALGINAIDLIEVTKKLGLGEGKIAPDEKEEDVIEPEPITFGDTKELEEKYGL